MLCMMLRWWPASRGCVCVHTKKTMILLWCRRRRKERKLFVQIFFSFASFIMIIKRWNSFLYYFLSTTFLNRLRFSLDFWKESLVWIFSSCVLHILCLCELYYPSVSSNIFFQIRYSKKFRFKNLFSTICWRPVRVEDHSELVIVAELWAHASEYLNMLNLMMPLHQNVLVLWKAPSIQAILA